MLTKRQKSIFINMKLESKLKFEYYNNWDFTIDKVWNEEERSFDFTAIKKQVNTEIDRLEFDFELEIFTKEEYYFKLQILNQIEKLCHERITTYNL